MESHDVPPRPLSTSLDAARPAMQNVTYHTSTSPVPPARDDTDPSLAAGPSSGAVPIPPPPNPRRHRSGVLMSRVRANSSGPNFRAGATGSKSFGDLGMSSLDVGDDDAENVPPWGKREGKRVMSEGLQRGTEEDDSMWDNSARFYHHLHSRPPSRSASRPASPTLSPATPSRGTTPETSTTTSPIYVRRSLTLPQNGQNAALSPNHIFLQQHLPPTFAEDHPSMVILTPTTQEWRELREIRRQEGDIDSGEDTSSGSDESRRSSVQGGSLLFDSGTRMPPLTKTMSADFLPVEAHHTPDPGSPVFTPADEKVQPVFNPVIIAPSPQAPENATVPPPVSPTRPLDIVESPPTSPEIDEDKPIGARDDGSAPARFNSIGRRESLRAIRPAAPRAKTKRELEREKLFKELDEEIEEDRPSLPARGSVQEIGMGWGLNSRPGSADQIEFNHAETNLDVEPTDVFDKQFEKTEAVAVAKASEPIEPKKIKEPPRSLGPITGKIPPAHLSPTQPMKPSPLHGSPLNAPAGLPTPESPYDSPPIFDLPSPEPAPAESHTANLDTIRSYARSLANPHPHTRAKSGVETPSPPTSPRVSKSRRRDTNRVSLVAGRVVQPFAIPPSTALPPDRPGLQTRPSSSSLQSFSPFRSPALGPAKSNGVPPAFNRLDSTISLAPSTGAPSECATPTSETAGGLGGRGIDDYVILKEAGKGAYGLVMRAKVKGSKGEPVGDEVIIKYIIKARILADCWKKHKELGPIPVEIHVMDQLRHLLYNPPLQPHPWDPMRLKTDAARSSSSQNGSLRNGKRDSLESLANTPDSPRSESSVGGLFSPTQKYIASEIKHSPERGHPNICKLLDFFEDREFYYLVMPRFGTGVDLFDRVESEPDGLDPFEVRSLLGQLTDAVRFLHSNGIIHRDIKDENVILDGKGRCQLIDFGSAAQWRPGKRWDTFSGTLHYASPEILRGGMYGGKEQDVWALGVVGYVLLVGETPFSDLPDEVLLGLTAESSAEAALEARCGGEHVDEGKEGDGGGGLADAADFVRRCLEMETVDRPSADVLCQHRYLRGEGGWVGSRGWVAAGWK